MLEWTRSKGLKSFGPVSNIGNRQVLMDVIVDHFMNVMEIRQQGMFITTKTGTKCHHKTTKGWEILIQWKDGGTSCASLKDIKESYPVQVTQYQMKIQFCLQSICGAQHTKGGFHGDVGCTSVVLKYQRVSLR